MFRNTFLCLTTEYYSGAGAGPADPAAAGPTIHKTNYFKAVLTCINS